MKKALAILLVLASVFTMVFAQGTSEGAADAPKAAEKMELVILSAGKEPESNIIREAFGAEYPNITLTFVEKDSAAVKTLLLSKSSDSDVVILVAQDTLDAAKEFLAPYKTANDGKFAKGFKDDQDRWYASSMPLQTFMYNTDLLKGDDIPKSWKDLADPKYKGKIVLANPSSSGSAYAQLYMMYKLTGDLSLAKAIAQNGTTYVTSSKAGPQGVARGEYALTMTGESNVSNEISNGSPVNYLYPVEGTGRRIEGSGIIDGCKNLEAAKIFMDWFTGKGGAEAIRAMGRRAVSTEVEGPANLPSLSEINFFDYDAIEAGELHDQLCNELNSFL